MSDCIFCKIVSGDIPSHTVYEDEHTLAFLDISPNNRGHTLVIPKQHTKNIFDISPEDWSRVCETVRAIAPGIKRSMRADGVNIAMNNEPSAGQLVLHAHVHIIPRFESDEFKHWTGTPYPDGEAEKVAEEIKEALM